MKTYTIEQFKKYLESQDSLGDIHYNLSEENIDKANEIIPALSDEEVEEMNQQEHSRTSYDEYF